MTPLDITGFEKMELTTFDFAQGSGPVYISRDQLMEFPTEESLLDSCQTESQRDKTEEEEDAEMEEEGRESEKPDTS